MHSEAARPDLPNPEALLIPQLGKPEFDTPLAARRKRFTGDDERVLVFASSKRLQPLLDANQELPWFEIAGPRRKLFFRPDDISCGIVTCGGLCPGLNDVIRSVVRTLWLEYGVRRILGFRYGYNGLSNHPDKEPLFLDLQCIGGIHHQGGTLLGSSRGPQDIGEMVDNLVRWKVNILFTLGGDGTLRGASALAREIKERNLKISVIGIPKTIDNDLVWIEKSFGFETAVKEADEVLTAAHTEARSAWNGVGLVKLMGRHSGFIAAYSTLTNGDVNFCLVPEVPFTLEEEGGFLDALGNRLRARHHALVVVAEGAGQNLVKRISKRETDASGNIKLADIGIFLKDCISSYLKEQGLDFTVKYIDPSYIIRSLRANPMDSAFCLVLGQHAVHAGMSGKTDMMIGFWNQHFTHVPLDLVAGRRKRLEPERELWQRVMEATQQPPSMLAATD